MMVAAGNHFEWECVEKEFRAIGFGEVVFKIIGRHVAFAAPINADDIVSAQALGLGDGIDGGITTANDSNTVTKRHLVQWESVDLFNKINGVDHLGKIFASDAKACAGSEANADE